MAFETEKKRFGREPYWGAKIRLDICSRVHGVSPCTATETGQDKCYNTLQTCNDVANYGHFGANFAFYSFISNKATNIINKSDWMPSILSVSVSPATIDIKGGLGTRSRVSIVFKDHPTADVGENVDLYLADRTLIALESGTFWTKFRARNPNYQNRPLSLFSGYIINGSAKDSAGALSEVEQNFIIDNMAISNGTCTITAKDPLKLASSGKALAPAPSTGELSATLLAGATSATLTPSGVGNSEYAASGKVAINKEVMSFTRSGDVLTLTRAENNTKGVEHASGDTVQECLEYNDQVNVIVEDLLTTYAGVDSSFITTAEWQSEIDTYISGLLDGIVTKPTDVNKLLKELAEAMPHYLWWDDIDQLIKLTALKANPATADVLDMDSHLVKGSVTVSDLPDMRRSTVFVNFGQFDPTKKLDESSNYQRTYARIDQDSITKYGSSEVHVINSRWINSNNKAAALSLAAVYGRRFSDIPRMIKFKLDPKDSDVWIGQNKAINHRDIVDGSGVPVDTVFQIVSAKRGDLYEYTGIEYTYGGALADDEGGGDPDVDLVIISTTQNEINLRTIFDTLYPTPDATTEAKFIIESGVKIGADLTTNTSMDTGSWPSGATVAIVNNGFIVGAGGKGQHATGTPAAVAGGLALILNHDIDLTNNGVIGGGGGGGGYATDTFSSDSADCDGGGGAGQVAGVTGGGYTYSVSISTPTTRIAAIGTLEAGGLGAQVFSDEILATAGTGGNLGQSGANGTSGTGAAAGDAIDKNGFTMTETILGDVRGSVVV